MIEQKIEKLIEEAWQEIQEADRPVGHPARRSTKKVNGKTVTTPERKNIAKGIKYSRQVADAFYKTPEKKNLNKNIAKAMSQTSNGTYGEFPKIISKTKEGEVYGGRRPFIDHLEKNPGAISSYNPKKHK